MTEDAPEWVIEITSADCTYRYFTRDDLSKPFTVKCEYNSIGADELCEEASCPIKKEE